MRSTLYDLVATDEARGTIADLTKRYWHEKPFTGQHFDRLRDSENPNVITERDLVAVSMLSVTVPAEVAIWILGNGRSEIETLLSEVPADADFWADSHNLDAGSPMDVLWRLLGQGCWPSPKRGNGMGRTTRSKLLATKRPALVPIWDSVVESVLGRTEDYWASLRGALDGEVRELWANATADAPEHVSLLRRIDAALWMYGKFGRGRPPT